LAAERIEPFKKQAPSKHNSVIRPSEGWI